MEEKAMRTVPRLLSLAAFAGCVATAGAQDIRPDERVAKLRVEAAKLEAGRSSELFKFLADGAQRDSLKLSGEQVDLADRLDQTTRRALRGWLLRGLNDKTPPTAAELDERFGQRWDRVRKNVNGHAEAIALEGILTPSQAQTARSRIRVAAAEALPGRYGRFPSTNAGEPKTAIEFHGRMRSLAVFLDRPGNQTSFLFEIITADQNRPPGASAEQLWLTRRIRDLASAICADWFRRGLGDAPARGDDSRIKELSSRLPEGLRLYDSIVAHAELIALETALTPKQAEWSKQTLWKRRGLKALFDPEVAVRLELAPSERDELLAQFVRAKRIVDQADDAAQAARMRAAVADERGTPDRALKATQATLAEAKLKQAASEMESTLMEMLTTSQAQLLRDLIGKSGDTALKADRAGKGAER
jgi:hypothetical protein